jgi:hypothetical protein
MNEKIKKLIKCIIPVCVSWIKKNDEDGMVRFIDPNDDEEISAHYGATHAAAAFIIWGKTINDDAIYQQGVDLLHSILSRWSHSKTLPAFHYDFNNFAISILEPFVDKETAKLIKDVVCHTEDSNHDTINWLPMRWLVNCKRMEWTNDRKYENNIVCCQKKITDATNADGGIEDRLPHGMSFNLQYDLATVAILQYLRVHGEAIDLSKELGFLLDAVAPDGDINYQGRGTNQIFAWGLWIYLLASSCQITALTDALNFLETRIQKMLDHNNMMLNGWNGSEKYLWWDYHYTSVYTAHCLLWLVLAFVDKDKKVIHPDKSAHDATGLHIHRSKNFFTSLFDGRTEYVAEKGPSIAAIWSKSQGMICKGVFAPWQGAFGNKYIYEDVVLKNYCGLLEIKRNKDWSKNRYVHKLLPHFETKASCKVKPLFCPINVFEKNNALELTWNNSTPLEVIFNLPAIIEECKVELFADGIRVPLLCNSAIKNQYGWVFLYQSRKVKAKIIKLIVR